MKRPSLGPVFSREATEVFEQIGEMGQPCNGWRWVKARLIRDTAVVGPEASSESASDPFEIVVIPEDLDSEGTIEFLGFTRQCAEEIMNRYRASDPGSSLKPFDYVQDHLLCPGLDAEVPNDDWLGAMTALGIKDKLQQAIMDPKFKDVRSTRRCSYWLWFSVEMRMRSLQEIGEIVQRKFASLTASTNQVPAPIRRNTGYTDRIFRNDHVVLWAAGDLYTHSRTFNQETGKVSLDRIAANFSDYSDRWTLPYFTPQRETADLYAKYYQHLSPLSTMTLAEVSVPLKFISSLNTIELLNPNSVHPGSSYEWRSLVFHSIATRILPYNHAYLARADLLIGGIVKVTDKSLRDMHQPYDIQPQNLLRINRGSHEVPAIQWAFQGENASDGFEQACQGKFTLHRLKQSGALRL